MFSVTWDLDHDEVTIRFDPKKTNPDKLAKIISELGYKPNRVEPRTAAGKESDGLVPAPLPKDAPQFFVDAFRSARAAQRPIVIDFWAKWCGPCMRLKKETFANAAVAEALKGVELILVDLDEYPNLAKAYGVSSIPDVFFVGTDGMIEDRLRAFEKAQPFLVRLKKLMATKGAKQDAKRQSQRDSQR